MKNDQSYAMIAQQKTERQQKKSSLNSINGAVIINKLSQTEKNRLW